MEQSALLTIIRTETTYRFRLDLPDNPTGQEYVTSLSTELRERLRRLLQIVHSTSSHSETRRLSPKTGPSYDAVQNLGRFLFDSLLPPQLQENLHSLDTPLLINSNAPEIPWELMYDNNAKPRRFLAQALSIGRTGQILNEHSHRPLTHDRVIRRAGKRETQGLSVLFLVNPTNERPEAEE